jgi:hypothetical protein
MPTRLAKEYADFSEGYNTGPLMYQERQFERLWMRNNAIKQELTQKTLEQIQRGKFERAGTEYVCYCRAAVPEEGMLRKDAVICSYRSCKTVIFHKSCVKKLGVDKVSRWYCTSCANEMKRIAWKTLRTLGYTDMPDEKYAAIQRDDEMYQKTFDEKLDALMDMTQDEYEKLMPPEVKKHLLEFGTLDDMPPAMKAKLRESWWSLGGEVQGVSVVTYGQK